MVTEVERVQIMVHLISLFFGSQHPKNAHTELHVGPAVSHLKESW